MQAADVVVAIGGEVNLVSALGESAEDRFEVAEVREVAPEEEDPHAVLGLDWLALPAEVLA